MPLRNPLLFQDHVENEGNPERKKECVGLQVSGLELSQQPANDLGGPVDSADAKTAYNPFIKPRRDSREEIVQENYGGLVKFIEIKTIPHPGGECAQFCRKRVSIGPGI